MAIAADIGLVVWGSAKARWPVPLSFVCGRMIIASKTASRSCRANRSKVPRGKQSSDPSELNIGARTTMGNWDTKLSARTVWENLCACEPRAMLGSRSPVA